MISFQNPGLIPIEAVTTMGVSVKEGPNPIGFFGTGLKYSIASLLRTGQRITIFRGTDRYDFGTEKGDVRGKEFSFILMNGPDGSTARLGFTTHLGAHWEMWQIFRELYSNCLDEQGEMHSLKVPPKEGWTTIQVSGEAFEEAARNKNKYFLTTPALHNTDYIDIHKGPSNHLFYRGVAVAVLREPSAHTYNIKIQSTLTEDRTLKDGWSANYYIARALGQVETETLLRPVLTNVKGYESNLSFAGVSEGFAKVVFDLAERLGEASLLPSAVRAAEDFNRQEARVKEVSLTKGDLRELEDAKAFLKQIGYEISAPIVVAETLGRGVFGMAKNDKIYISRTTLTRGGNFLIGTLLEEHLHLSQGFRDESRAFQDFLIDLVVKLAKDAQI